MLILSIALALALALALNKQALGDFRLAMTGKKNPGYGEEKRVTESQIKFFVTAVVKAR
jgi:hypothetical protein